MKRAPRWAARGGGLAVALLLGLAPAAAQTYPSQDVHVICAFPPGSGADVIVRYMSEKLRPLMGRSVIVENKPGALGNIATEYVARSKPDGYTLYIHGGSGVAASMSMLRKPPFDVGKAIELIATINRQPTMIAVHASKPWTSLPALTDYVRQQKEKATYATTNPVGKVMGAIYKERLGLTPVEVNYKTASDSLNDLASGAIDYALFDNVFAMAQQREGRIRILAVSTAQRLQANSDLPTMTELGVPMDLTGYFSVMAPAGVPRSIVEQIYKWTNQVVASDDTREFLNKFGSDPWVSAPGEGQAYFVKDITAWQEYIRLAKIEPQG